MNKMLTLSRCKPLLGTYVEINLSASKQTNLKQTDLINASNQAFSEIERIHNMMSFHDSKSELSQLNRSSPRQYQTLSKDMLTVFKVVDFLHKESNGDFDVCIAKTLIDAGFLPNTKTHNVCLGSWSDVKMGNDGVFFNKPVLLDLGGIAKGYAVDQAFRVLQEYIQKELSVVINAGGDLRMSHWKGNHVAINQPASNNKTTLQTCLMFNSSLATTASYYNQNHSLIVDPSTQKTIDCADSISVFADSCVLADALTKIIFLKRFKQQKYHGLLKKLSAKVVIGKTDNV